MKKRKEIPGSFLTSLTPEQLYQNWPKDQVDEDLAKLAEYKSWAPPRKATGPPLVKGDKGPRVYPKPTSISDLALRLDDSRLVPFYGAALVKSERARLAAGLPQPATAVVQESAVAPLPDPNEDVFK